MAVLEFEFLRTPVSVVCGNVDRIDEVSWSVLSTTTSFTELGNGILELDPDRVSRVRRLDVKRVGTMEKIPGSFWRSLFPAILRFEKFRVLKSGSIVFKDFREGKKHLKFVSLCQDKARTSIVSGAD
jgi:hypothetical protein